MSDLNDLPTHITDESKSLYADYRKDLLSRQLSNSENFDRAILSLSSGILAISVAFIKGATSSSTPRFIAALGISWIAFALAIVFTVVSFMTSQLAIDRHLEFAKHYYLQGREEALQKSSPFRTVTSWLNGLSGFAFVTGVVLTIVFALANLP